MAKIEREEDSGLLEQMKKLRELLKVAGGKELLSDEDWLVGESSHIETEIGGADSVEQFVIKKKSKKGEKTND